MIQIKEEWINGLLHEQEKAQKALDSILETGGEKIIMMAQINTLSRFIGFAKSAKTFLNENWDEVDG